MMAMLCRRFWGAATATGSQGALPVPTVSANLRGQGLLARSPKARLSQTNWVCAMFFRSPARPAFSRGAQQQQRCAARSKKRAVIAMRPLQADQPKSLR